MKLILLKTED